MQHPVQRVCEPRPRQHLPREHLLTQRRTSMGERRAVAKGSPDVPREIPETFPKSQGAG